MHDASVCMGVLTYDRPMSRERADEVCSLGSRVSRLERGRKKKMTRKQKREKKEGKKTSVQNAVWFCRCSHESRRRTLQRLSGANESVLLAGES